MKKRIISLLLSLALILSLLPMSVFAATDYNLYINDFQFASDALTYTGEKGTATYDPGSKTLTLDNLTVSTHYANGIIWNGGISGLTIRIKGTVTINLLESSSLGGTDYAAGMPNFAFMLQAATTITGASGNKDTDKIVINSTSVNDRYTAVNGFTRIGINTTAALTLRNVTLSMTDNSANKYAGRASLICAGGYTSISGCKLDAQKCSLGLYMLDKASANIEGTEFSMDLYGYSFGLNFAPGTTSYVSNCSGTINASFPLYTNGKVTVNNASGGKLTLNGSGAAVYATAPKNTTTGGEIIFQDTSIDLTSPDDTGISVGPYSSVELQRSKVNVTAPITCVYIDENASLSLTGGTQRTCGLYLHGTNPAERGTIGIYTKGYVSTGGSLTGSGGRITTDNLYVAIQNVGTGSVGFYDGTHTFDATGSGYIDAGGGTLRVRENTDVTINAPVGVYLTQGKGGKFEMSGGTLNVNSSDTGLLLDTGAGKTALSGGTLNITGTATTDGGKPVGISARSEIEFGGTTVNFRNCSRDLLSLNAANKLTAGKLSLSGSMMGAQLSGGFEMTGGEIVSDCATVGIAVTEGTAALKGGKLDLKGSGYPFYLSGGGILDFAGATVDAVTSQNCALFVDYVKDASGTVIRDESGKPSFDGSYKITDGTVTLQSAQAAANALYTSIADTHGVWVGADEASAAFAANVTQALLATNKYARFAEKASHTLTLVNVKEGTSATHPAGSSLTYTAKDAPAGQHFSHWELTVGNDTTNVGTNPTYTGTMPDGDATLTAVYENCSGGKATCVEQAKCDICGRPYGELGNHDFTAETAEAKYLKSEATCESAAVYYKSCAVCGESSKGTEVEATFTSGDLGDHDWNAWTSNGDGTHTRTCKLNTAHTETENCHGGTADCSHKAVCNDCHGEYGDFGAHSYTAETVDAKYLKTEADCDNAAVYYKSCSGCGATSKDTEAEATFTSGDPLGHDWGDWTSNGDGTHTHACKHNAAHTETQDCHGGEATCREKAVCDDCHGEYGELGDHLYNARVEDRKYLKAEANCAHGTLYYYSCSVCGASSEGTEDDTLFEVGDRLGHEILIILETELFTEGARCGKCGEILTAPQPKIKTFWTDDGNYDAELYASAPGNWVISDAADLAALAKKVGDGFTFEGCTITLTADIDLSGHRWIPIGYHASINTGGTFKGAFEGGGHNITNMFACPQNYSHAVYEVGLFGWAENATICDLQVSGTVFFDSREVGSSHAGGLIAWMKGGTVRNCSFVGSVCLISDATYGQTVGGLIGGIDGGSTVENCYVIADVTASAPNTAAWTGGLCGMAGYTVISNCYAVCRLSNRASRTSNYIGAISATAYSGVTISDCYAQSDYAVFGSAERRVANGTLLSKADLQSADGIVPALNETVRKHSSRALNGWVLDPAQNGGYPTFGAAVWFENSAKDELLDCQIVPFGGTVTFPTTLPQDDTYEITGWCTDAAGKNDFDLTQPITGNLTLYAKWTLRPDHKHLPGVCKIGTDGLHDYVCTLCGNTFDCKYTTKVVPATCTASGYTVHTCVNCGNSYIDTLVVGGHDWVTTVTPPTHTEMGYTYYECSVCKENYKTDYTAPVGHTFDDGTVAKEATCTEEGKIIYTCSCGATHTAPIPKTGHELVDTVTAPTCTELGYTTHSCKHCDYTYTDTPVAALGHKWDNGTVTTPATCTADGEMTYACFCGATRTAPIPKTGHELVATVTAPTCTELGYTTHTCKHCDYTYTDTPVAALGHKWDGGKVAAAPSLTETGKLIQTCTVCKATKESVIPMLSDCDGGEGCPSSAYKDVPGLENWAHVGIDFVLKSGLFYGTSDTTFSPDNAMTRAMLVTVLYRLEGQPKVSGKNPFSDVKSDTWYTDAVIWAAENKIVNGIGGGKFDPDGKITREQMAAILYRYSTFKGLTLTEGKFAAEYPDEKDISAYALDAMSWANAEALINGTGIGSTVYLDPQGNATRAQVAAILMRYVQNVLRK